MDRHLAPFISHMEILLETDKYTYYFDKKKKEIAIYNGYDIMIFSAEQLGNLAFYGSTDKLIK